MHDDPGMNVSGRCEIFTRILVPIDLSADAPAVPDLASRLARFHGAELIVLHVLSATPVDVDAAAAERTRAASDQLAILRADQRGR